MKDPVKLLKDILEIYSPSGSEEELASYISNWLDKAGVRSVKDNGNIIAEVGRGEPILLLCSHMDTIQGFINVREEDGRIYGRGAVDAKSSLAAMIFAISELAKEDLEGKVILACVVDEEGESRGMSHLLDRGLKASYAIFGEPSFCRHIIIGYRGSANFKLKCEVPLHHPASAYQIDAIQVMISIWDEVRKAIEMKSDQMFYSTTLHPITIRGDRCSCELLFNVRYPVGRTVKEIDNCLSQIIEKFNSAQRMAKVHKTMVGYCNPIICRRSSLVARALARAIFRVSGEKPIFAVKTGSSDMNLLHGTGIEAVSFGPGNPSLQHTECEYIDVEEYLQAIRIYNLAAKELIKLHKHIINVSG